MTLLEFHDVGLNIGERALLENINLSIRQGEFLSILGPNGAGKSSLMSLMSLTWKPTKGLLKIFGEDAQKFSVKQINQRRRRIGLVPQQVHFNWAVPLTVYEVVEMAQIGMDKAERFPKSEEKRLIESSLEQMGIQSLSRRPYRSLSGGERQKVQLARALAQQPEILILDEPTAGLDMDWQERLVQLIINLYRRYSLTVILATHITGHIPPCCSRIILLGSGRIIADGKPSEVLNVKYLSKLYNCPLEIYERNGRTHCIATGDFDE